MLAGAGKTQRRQRVDLTVDLGDPRLERVEEVVRRDPTAPQLVDQRARIGLDKVKVTWHPLPPLLYSGSIGYPDRPH